MNVPMGNIPAIALADAMAKGDKLALAMVLFHEGTTTAEKEAAIDGFAAQLGELEPAKARAVSTFLQALAARAADADLDRMGVAHAHV